MIPKIIEGWNKKWTTPEGWSKDRCGDLHVKEEMENGIPVMSSAWEPTPAELAILNAGGSVVLGIIGVAHPPVKLYVTGTTKGFDVVP